MFLLSLTIFGIMPGQGSSSWSWGNPYYTAQQQAYSGAKNVQTYQDQRAENWKDVTTFGVPVLLGTGLLGALTWGLRSIRKREFKEPHQDVSLSELTERQTPPRRVKK